MQEKKTKKSKLIRIAGEAQDIDTAVRADTERDLPSVIVHFILSERVVLISRSRVLA